MFSANTRSSLTSEDFDLVIAALSEGDQLRFAALQRLFHSNGPDALLDDPALARVLLGISGLTAPSVTLFVYVLVRRHLVDAGIDDRELADYLAAMILEFSIGKRSLCVASGDEREASYLVDLLAMAANCDGEERFRVQAHLGNYALWLAGMFPDRIAARRVCRGGPDVGYYDSIGRRGFAGASGSSHARRQGLQPVLALAAECFPAIRASLNRLSDTIFFPDFMSRDKLLRQLGRVQ